MYIYAANNPILWVDENGEAVHIAAGAIFGGLAGGFYPIYSQIDRPGGIDWGNVAEATIAGAVFGAMTGATFGLGAAALYGTAAGVTAGTISNVFFHDYHDAVHYPWEKSGTNNDFGLSLSIAFAQEIPSNFSITPAYSFNDSLGTGGSLK